MLNETELCVQLLSTIPQYFSIHHYVLHRDCTDVPACLARDIFTLFFGGCRQAADAMAATIIRERCLTVNIVSRCMQMAKVDCGQPAGKGVIHWSFDYK